MKVVGWYFVKKKTTKLLHLALLIIPICQMKESTTENIQISPGQANLTYPLRAAGRWVAGEIKRFSEKLHNSALHMELSYCTVKMLQNCFGGFLFYLPSQNAEKYPYWKAAKEIMESEKYLFIYSFTTIHLECTCVGWLAFVSRKLLKMTRIALLLQSDLWSTFLSEVLFRRKETEKKNSFHSV